MKKIFKWIESLWTILFFSLDDFPLFSQIAFNNYFALCGLLACVGFILVIILSKQKLITSKDSISNHAYLKRSVAEQPLPEVPEGSWVGSGAGMKGRLHPRQHCEEAKKWDFLGEGAIKSGTSHHDNHNLCRRNHRRERMRIEQESQPGVHHESILKWVPI